ncbi:MAG: hypothetical protein HFH48_10885 [Lachnospiraceae bacterium]|nr:hypothetical protein [Lachnospiraceae bacterium]
MGLCEARIVCMGIGDNSQELTQLSLYRKKSELLQYLAGILPEFSALSIIICIGPANMREKYTSVPGCL